MTKRVDDIVGRGFDTMEVLLTVNLYGIDSIKKQHVVVNIEMQLGAKVLS